MATFPDLDHIWIDHLYPEVSTGNDGALKDPIPAPIVWELSPVAMRTVDVIPAAEVAVKKPSKTFLCHVVGCTKRYSAIQDLKAHVVKQHGRKEIEGKPEFKDKKTKEGKDWPCPHEDCPSGYMKPHELNRHLLRKHEKKPGLSESEKVEKLSKPYPCSWPDCKFSFDQRWAINKHVGRKHGGKTYELKETEEKKSLKIFVDTSNKARLEEKR